jgi:hypothetical protein
MFRQGEESRMPNNSQSIDEDQYDALEIARHHEDEARLRQENRMKQAKRRASRVSRHRLRLVDDIINRLWGRRYQS